MFGGQVGTTWCCSLTLTRWGRHSCLPTIALCMPTGMSALPVVDSCSQPVGQTFLSAYHCLCMPTGMSALPGVILCLSTGGADILVCLPVRVCRQECRTTRCCSLDSSGGADILVCQPRFVCADRNVGTTRCCSLTLNRWGRHSCLPTIACVCRQECRHYLLLFSDSHQMGQTFLSAD